MQIPLSKIKLSQYFKFKKSHITRFLNNLFNKMSTL